MKNRLFVLASFMVGLTLATVNAQPGPPSGPNFDGAMAKLFGDNSAFSATLEFQIDGSSGDKMTIPGKIAFSSGNSRFDMDISAIQGGRMPPQAAAQMKKMGMGTMSALSLADKKLAYLIYPDMKAYVENSTQAPRASAGDYKSEATKLGTETIDGHECVKNKMTVTGPDGKAQESTVWNASDLKQFPLKIQMQSDNGLVVMHFKDVKLDKPDASQFELPADFTRYESMMSLMMGRARGMRSQ